MISQDSAKFWFPKLDACPDPWFRAFLPKTLMIDYDEELLSPALHGKPSKEYDRLYYAVEAAIRYEIAGPAFIRTDITSAKHAGKEAWSVPNEDALNDALLRTLAASQLKTYFQKIKGSAIMVRPLLDIAATRTAFNGLPVGMKEWRVFAFLAPQPERRLSPNVDSTGRAGILDPGSFLGFLGFLAFGPVHPLNSGRVPPRWETIHPGQGVIRGQQARTDPYFHLHPSSFFVKIIDK